LPAANSLRAVLSANSTALELFFQFVGHGIGVPVVEDAGASARAARGDIVPSFAALEDYVRTQLKIGRKFALGSMVANRRSAICSARRVRASALFTSAIQSLMYLRME